MPVVNEEPIFAPGSESDAQIIEFEQRKVKQMSDWKEKAIAAHTAKIHSESESARIKAERIEGCLIDALESKLLALFGALPTEAGTKFKVVRDKSKPAEDVNSWDLYMGKSDRWHSDSGMYDWYGPITTIEQVGEVLVNNPTESLVPYFHYQREPEDYGSGTPPKPPVFSMADDVLSAARGADGETTTRNPESDRTFYVLASIAESLRELVKKS